MENDFSISGQALEKQPKSSLQLIRLTDQDANAKLLADIGEELAEET